MYYLGRIIKRLSPVSVKDSIVNSNSKIEGGTVFIGSTIGRYSYCGYDCTIINTSIGAFCSIAGNVSIGLANHPVEWVSTSSAFYYGRDSISKRLARRSYDYKSPITTIENDVWIGESVMIKAGVHVSNGAVIGMGSVLTKDVGPYEIWAGNPAKMIRKRFADEVIAGLAETKWWELNEEELIRLNKFMNKPEDFIRVMRGELDGKI